MKSLLFALVLSAGFVFTSCNSDQDVTPGGSTGTDSVQVAPPDSTIQTHTGGSADTTATN